ncbi:GTPase-activating protein skywalker-like isoform X2 [Pecten maximus]|uniref:GTPase-activating protein skywalker-like isoform X2 n=1 Tax=Pecten maximus TaxID=6579 RepID=UPI0014580C99|nr:GTPase-activating protein skywalker-like isoform X2 [Pecten maximus]
MNTDLLGLISHEELSLPVVADQDETTGKSQGLLDESCCTDDGKREVKEVENGVAQAQESKDTAPEFPTESETDCDLKSNSLTKDPEQPLPYGHTNESEVKLQFVYDTKEEFYGEKVLLLPFDENNTSSTDDIEPTYIDSEKSAEQKKTPTVSAAHEETIQADESGDEERLLLPESDLSLNVDDTGQDSNKKDAKEETKLDHHSKEGVDENLSKASLGARDPLSIVVENLPSEDENLPEDCVNKCLSKDSLEENLSKENLEDTLIDITPTGITQAPPSTLTDSKDELDSKEKSESMISEHLHNCSSQESMEKKSSVTLLDLARGDNHEEVESDKEQTILIPCVKFKDVLTKQTELETLDIASIATEQADIGTESEATGVEGILHEHSSDDETEPKSEDVDGDLIAQESGIVKDSNLIDQESDIEEGQPEVTVHEEKKIEDNEVSVYDHPFVSDVNVESVNYPVSCLAKEKKRKRKDNNLKDNEDHMKSLLVSLNIKHLKAFLRTSLWSHDHQMRGLLWQQACKYLHKADGNFYEEMVEELFNQRGQTAEVTLPSFVDFDNLPTYHLNTSGIQSVHKILAVMHHTNPDITYCPILFGLVSVFLHYMTPSDAYNCAYGLLRSKETFIMQTKVSFEASKLVARDLAKKYAKSAYVNIVRNTNNIDSVFDSWYWWIFKDLPFPYLVCILDCFILEGIKVFYRAALAIIILYIKHTARRTRSSSKHGHADSASSIRQFCREFPFRTDKLLRTGFGVRGLTRKHIKKLQLKNEMYINSHHLHPSASSQSMNGHRRANSGPTNIHIEGGSTIVSQEMLYTVWSWLPPRFAVCQPELLYTSEEHGTSLMTLYTRVEDHQPTLIVIKTTNDEVFGAFCSTYWRDRKRRTKNLSYFGTGETFIFTLSPKKQKYSWVGLKQEDIPNTANMFLAGDNSMLTVGGGNGEAIQLDANLHHCRTEKCDTFLNEPLCAEQDFTCKVVEVYGFV